MKILDLPRHLRPREKLIEKGPEHIKDKELLAIVLRSGMKGKNAIELADKVLQKYPIKKLIKLSYEELISIEGIDTGKACTLLASIEFTKRALMEDTTLPSINSPLDAVAQLSHIRNLKKEHFIVILLNARNHVMKVETVSIGTLNASIVHPREVFEPALQQSACSIIIAHNHPSGDAQPSSQDVEITSRLKNVGELMGIDILDHIIVTRHSFFSFKEEELL